MNEVVFMRPRQEYASYQDLWRLITMSGYRIKYVDEINWDEDITVIGLPKHSSWDSIPKKRRAKLVWYNTERLHRDAPLMDMSNPFIPACVDEVWAADKAIADIQQAKYVFLGGHQAFGSVNVRAKHYDIIHLMAPMPRRHDLLRQLNREFTIADTGDLRGAERHERLRASKLMVMAHQDEHRWVMPPRMMIGACYALPMICEECVNPGHWGDVISFVPLDRIVSHARVLLEDDVKLARMAAKAWRLVCRERTFASQIEEALL
jgi:hypothetical protein